MSTFAYKAKEAAGEVVTGTLEAENAAAAARSLFQRSLSPITITMEGPGDDGDQGSEGAGAGFFGSRVDPVDTLLFSQQMGIMLKAGVPILRALAGIWESSTNAGFAAVVLDVRRGLDSGKALSACLAGHPERFSNYYVSMVQIGEMTGKLEDVFLKLYDHLEFDGEMRGQVKSAVKYPMMVVGVMAVAILIINFFVIPAFAEVYAGFKAELPIYTRLLIGFSDFLIGFGPLLAMGAAMAGFAARRWVETEAGRLRWDGIKMRLPIAGPIVHKATMARFCRSLALSMESGVPIAAAISMVAESAGNAWLTQRLGSIKSRIEHGEALYKACQATGVFTPIALQMILVGEESGQLDTMLSKVAGLYQSQVEYEVKSLGSQIEPILLLFLGGLLLVMALGVFLPVWNLSSVAFAKH